MISDTEIQWDMPANFEIEWKFPATSTSCTIETKLSATNTSAEKRSVIKTNFSATLKRQTDGNSSQLIPN